MTLDHKRIYARGCRVLLDRDAAEYFQVDLRTLKAAVRRERSRFPPDAMIVFNGEETGTLDAQRSATGPAQRRRAWGFTELGIELLAGVLKSDRAIAHSIETIRKGVADFARVRAMRA